MGVGPFVVDIPRYGVRFRIAGTEAFSGIREMYGRDVYLRNGTLTIRDGDHVVDLGANIGNFTNLALAHGPNVQVVAVEPGAHMNASFSSSVGLNPGYLERTRLINAFVGSIGGTQEAMLRSAEYRDAKWNSEDELISSAGTQQIDFLKCDIEGGEFGLLTPRSRLLHLTQSLAVEIHQFAGDVEGFIAMLRGCGFSILARQTDPDGFATVLARRLA